MAESPSKESLEDEENLDSQDLELGNLHASPYAARVATPDAGTGGDDLEAPSAEEEDSPPSLPPAKDHKKLRLAASDMVEFGISLDNAAAHHEVDRDTLHVFYRTYIKFVGKDNVPDPHGSYASVDRGDFDRSSHRQFDRNWAEMMFQADRDRPQLTGLRRQLVDSPLTAWLFNGHVLDKIAVTGAACVIGFGLLVFKRTRNDADPNPPPPPPPSKWTQGEDIDGLERDQQIDLLNQILEELTTFIEAKSWKERLPRVRDAEEVGPLMERYYKTHPDGPITPIVVEPDISFLDRPDGKFALVQATLRKADSEDQKLVFLMEISAKEAKFLIDWKVLVNYEPIPWEKFQEARSEEPSQFRVRVSPGDYYNHPFMDENEFLSLHLSFLHRPDKDIHGFARRDSQTGKTLEKILEGELDESRAAILNLRFPEGAKFDNVLEVESVVSDRW